MGNALPRLAFVTERTSVKARHILPYLSKNFGITLITYSDDTEIPEGQYRSIIRVPIPKHEMMPTTAWRMSRLVDRLYVEGAIDFAYVYSSVAYLIRKCPYVNIVNGCYREDFKVCMSYAPWMNRLRAPLGILHYVLPEMIACKRAVKLIPVSAALGTMVQEYYGRQTGDIYPVQNGMSEEYLQLYDARKFDERPLNILYTGRLHFRKGIVRFCREFVRRKDIESHFWIAGDGPDRASLEALARNDKRVHVVGHLDRKALAELLKTTHIYAFPSLHEGFGLSLAEAMASGHACIVYDMPVNREVLGNAGLFCRYGDHVGLVNLLAACVADLQLIRQKAEEAHLKAKEYSWDRCASEMEAALSRVYRDVTEASV